MESRKASRVFFFLRRNRNGLLSGRGYEDLVERHAQGAPDVSRRSTQIMEDSGETAAGQVQGAGPEGDEGRGET